jgi:hypothetical protein
MENRIRKLRRQRIGIYRDEGYKPRQRGAPPVCGLENIKNLRVAVYCRVGTDADIAGTAEANERYERHIKYTCQKEAPPCKS